jgi:hypothetical protein
MDNELFKLCKDVYRRTGWKDTSDVIDFYEGKYTVQKDCSGYVDPFKNGVYWSPLYTSDYLLEKLPEEINKRMLVITNGERPHAGYAQRDNYGNSTLDDYFYGNAQYSNSVLKALLKLTITLDDAGELK